MTLVGNIYTQLHVSEWKFSKYLIVTEWMILCTLNLFVFVLILSWLHVQYLACSFQFTSYRNNKGLAKTEKKLPPSPQILQINLNILQHIAIWLMPQNFLD